MKTLEDQLSAAGLVVVGCCQRLSQHDGDLMQTSPLLQDMTPEEADILGQAMLLVRVAPGQVLIKEGESGDWMLLILSGTVDVSKKIPRLAPAAASTPTQAPEDPAPADGDAAELPAPPTSSRVAVLQRGAAVGEMSMLDNEPRYASCTAIEAVDAGVLGRRAIALLIRDHPSVGAKLLVKITQLMAQRLRNTGNQLVKLLHPQTPDQDH